VVAAVRALQAGPSEDASEVLYLRFYRPLLLFFQNQTELREDAEDLAQGAFFQALANIRQYKFNAPFGIWLRRIGENVWLNAVRARRAVKRGPQPSSLSAPERRVDDEEERLLEVGRSVFAAEAATPEEVALDREAEKVLAEELATLPAGMRRCFELRFYGELEYHEIAAVTGVSVGAVRSQLFEARQRLQPHLGRYLRGGDL
jgi:RNA polymerase sigma-70 factor (ECF subfamily)